MSGRLPRGPAIALLLAPAVTVVAVLFCGGLGLAVAQSFGWLPFLAGWRWSLDGYRQLAADPAVRASLALTLRVALLSTSLATLLGVAGALLLHRLPRGRRALTAVFASTLPVPHLVGALAVLLLLGQSGLLSRLAHAAGLTASPAGFPALTADRFGVAVVVELAWKEAPFVGLAALTALSSGVDELEAAARTLGAGPWHRLRTVVLPLLAPSVLASSVLVLAVAAGGYEVPYLLGRPYPATLPVVALQRSRDVDLAARPEAMAIAVVVALLGAVLVAAYAAVVGRAARRAL